MKKVLVFSFLSLAGGGLFAQSKPAPKPRATATVKASASTPAGLPLRSSSDSLSYAFGISLGEFLKNQGVSSISFPLLNQAITQTLKGQKTFLDVNQCNQLIGKVAEQKREKLSGTEKAAGAKFLAENKKRAGVITTASGLQYEILTKGTGPVPSLSDTINAHYRGALLDGKEFDNSYKRGEPLSIPVAGVIPGWTEALQLMPVGSKWKLFIPSELAYGDYGAGQDIPGGATLVFDIELIEIKNKK